MAEPRVRRARLVGLISERLTRGATTMVTTERLHQLVDALPEGEREAAARLLEGLLRPPVVSGDEFVDAAPGRAVLRPDAPPIADIDDLRGDFWPADEGPDDFVNAVRAWRREGGRG
jgi:hypothetical protein